MNYPTKKANTDYNIIQPLQNRWSPRVFSDKEITDDQMKQLLEAGRWAPSSNNFQPWRIIWGKKGSETYDQIFDCLLEFNQGWAGNGQVLMACAFKKSMPNGKENFHALHDLGAFSAFLTFQAESMGIAVHQMAGIDFKKANKVFEFGDEYHVATAISLGFYGGNPEDLNESLEKQETNPERSRIPQSSFAFNGPFPGEQE